jgi:ferric-dicitrate binding protein FerR (iron transport regulator)
MDTAQLIEKVLSGLANSHEKRQLENWLQQHPENKLEYQDIKLLLAVKSLNAPPVSHEKFKRNLISITRKSINRTKTRKSIRKITLVLFLILLTTLTGLWLNTLAPSTSTAFPQLVSFNNEPLKSIATLLKRQYNIALNFQSADLHACRFTGTIFKPDDELDILTSIAKSLNLSLIHDGNKNYQLAGTGCIQGTPHNH